MDQAMPELKLNDRVFVHENDYKLITHESVRYWQTNYVRVLSVERDGEVIWRRP